MSPSYGHAYLTSFGWRGTGTGLRVGAIDKPLTIPPKKNLSGLGKDRDEAFPFWDHLFTAASKAITIKVSNDDEDDEEPFSDTVPSSAPLRRTATGIISNRQPISGTPASTSVSGSTTPNPDGGPASGLSLIATAKREAAKRGLYARFFRGPVLGPDDDPPGSTSHLAPESCESSSVSTPVPKDGGDQDDIVGESRKRKKRKSVETKEERRERKRLKKERKAARAAKKAEKAEKVKKKKERKAHEQRDQETHSEENTTSKKGCKHARKSVAGLEGDDVNPAKLEDLMPTDDGHRDTSHKPPSNADTTDTCNVAPRAKRRRKRKDTPP